MKITIEQPYILALIPVLLLVLIFSMRWFSMKNRIRKNVIFALHSLAILCLVMALSGMHIQKDCNQETTIFLLDVSDSVAAKEKDTIEFVSKALESCPTDGKVGIVAFGSDARVEQFVSNKISFGEFETAPVTGGTNLEKAVQTALTMYDEESAKRLVLVTDGNENEGTLSNITNSITGNEVQVEVLKLENNIGSETYIDGVKVSETVKIGDEFNVEVTVKSNVKTTALLSLYQGDTLKKQEKVELQTGSNRFVFQDKQTEGGLKTYRAELEPVKDSNKKNNSYTAFTKAEEAPKLLLIEGMNGQGDEFCKILDNTNANYEVCTAKTAPISLNELLEYKGIVMLDVYAKDLPKGFLQHLEAYVKDYGGGFVTIGGENSYALGGYRNTAIEKVLPVKMELEGEKQIPDMAIVFVIDRSGSMDAADGGYSNLDLAKNATEAALENLREIDEVGVIEFESNYSWAVPLQKYTDKDGISSAIDEIPLGGGTNIFGSLKAAVKGIKKSDAKLKHIIVLSDGEDGYPLSSYSKLVGDAVEEEITISTVAIGTSTNPEIMNGLAEEGKGRCYTVQSGEALPRIFAQEIYLSTKSYLNNREFVPTVCQNRDLLEGVTEAGLPSLLGYVSTTAKDMATIYLESDQGDPILAGWQYGLGKTVAFTSDGENKWTSNYANWSEYSKLWKNILQWIVLEEEEDGAAIEIEQTGTSAHVSYKTENSDESTKIKIIATDENGKQKDFSLDATGIGAYEGDLDFGETGLYMLNFSQENQGEIAAVKNTAVAIQYSQEYRYLEENKGFDTVIEQMGGTIIEKPKDVFNEKLDSIEARFDCTNIWIAIALFLFCFYLVYSRLQLTFVERWIEAVRKKKTSKNKEETQKKETQTGKEKNTKKSHFNKEEKKKGKKTKKQIKKETKKEEQEKMQSTAELLLKKKKER